MIAPPVRGALLYNRRTYSQSLFLFATGAVISAATVGAIYGALGVFLASEAPFLRIACIAILGAVAATYGAAELYGVTWWVPTRHWQVPKEYVRYGMPFYAAAFGLILGVGFLTFVTSVGYYLLIGICLLVGDPFRAALLMGVFGLARTVPVLLAPSLARAKGQPYTQASIVAFNNWIARTHQRFAHVRALVLLAVAGFALDLLAAS